MGRYSFSPRRFGLVAATAALMALGSGIGAHGDSPATNFAPTPDLPCGVGDLPETIQGRTPLADYSDGRAEQGYTCNASQVSHVGTPTNSASVGGYRVYRYTDADGTVCAFYDTTLLFPTNVAAAGTGLTGVWVLDMTDPAHPVHTATLSTPAMQSPHESFSLNASRGLIGAVFANPAFYHGQFDLYDVRQDCTHPALQSTLPMGFLGHEGSFSPDGNTYWATSLYGHTMTAIDVTNPLLPVTLFNTVDFMVHGLNLSDDGKTMYFADITSNPTGVGPASNRGLTVLDVSEIQDRKLNPQAHIVSRLTWPVVGTPQTNLPITIGGHPYLVEVDEFGSADHVGAARIIDIADPAAPAVVSNMRLAVNNPDHNSTASQQADPNATNSLSGYTGHYCGVPKKDDPGIVACSFILSGLRVFDIHDPLHPVEIAYFNKPATTSNAAQGPQGAYAMSQPAFDAGRRQIWYSDGNTGFYVVQLTNNVWNP